MDPSVVEDIDEDWEEWDGISPFWHHCVAGSMAGLTEHTLVYPLDTVRTHIQVCASCQHNPAVSSMSSGMSSSAVKAVASNSPLRRPTTATRSPIAMTRWAAPSSSASPTTASGAARALPQGMWQTIRYLMSEPAALTASATTTTTTKPPNAAGIFRLWRGVQTMVIGCIPAHALYFSSYEMTKAYFAKQQQSNGTSTVWYGAMMAGAVATVSHDMIMAPLDTVKQRLQLGHYHGSVQTAITQMAHKEGLVALYRSFPITLLANVPYGMIMVSTNEYWKDQWTPEGQRPSLSTTLCASSMAGLVASALTTPLDRIKTSLQTQQLAPACWPTVPPACPQQARMSLEYNTGRAAAVPNGAQAFSRIWHQEGAVGLFRGVVPRVLSHTPAVAISWTTYETAKSVLWNSSQ